MTLRTNDASLDRALRVHLVDRLAEAPRDAPVNFSVEVAADRKRFHRLWWGGCVAARTRDVGRLLVALDRHLGAAGDGFADLRVDAPAAVRGREAVLLPPAIHRRLAPVERPLRAIGWILTDMPFAELDVDRQQLVVDAPGVLDVPALLATWGAEDAAGDAEPIVPPGRYDLAELLFTRDVSVAPSALVVSLAGHLRQPPAPDRIVALHRLVAACPCREVRDLPRGLVRHLRGS